ncbi:hypothetical protein P8452_61202 [Trifolium repens]|nr:hypothetical protein P8452_61202 [Trifolium repens]
MEVVVLPLKSGPAISRLEGFVANREQSYEDPIKELLYAVFVVSNENELLNQFLEIQAYHLPRSAASDEDASVASQASENMFIDNDSTQQRDV